jgi:hypothetical protein
MLIRLDLIIKDIQQLIKREIGTVAEVKIPFRKTTSVMEEI